MIHGVESDWIEEEMADDDDFRWKNKLLIQHSSIYVKYDLRKDVLEQKVKKALEEIGFSKKIIYKVYRKRWNENDFQVQQSWEVSLESHDKEKKCIT